MKLSARYDRSLTGFDAGPKRQLASSPSPASVDRQRHQRLVEHDDARAGRRRAADRALGAALAAQQPRQPVAPGRDQLGDAGLQHLPDAGARLDRERIGAGEEREVGDARERAIGEIDDRDVAEIEPRGRPGMQRRDQPADPRRPAERRRQREAVLAGTGPGGDASRPGHGVHRRERLVRGRALAELRQVEDRDRRRPVDDRPRHPHAAVRARRQAVGAGVGAHRLDRPRAGVGDAGQPQRREPAVVVEPHHVAGIERQPRRRQPEGRGLAADPFLEQRPAAAALGVAGGRGDGEALGGHAQA